MNIELIVKDVEFHGDMLRAAQDPDGKVWVGVRWVCQGMGFDNERMKNERKKIQRDIVLNEGVKFYPLGSGNSDTQVLCLDLDYIPLWLAKIAITPTMQRENPVLVNKLIDYQLKAKDVLAAAFLGDKKTTEDIIPVYKPQGNMIQLQFPDIQMPTIPDYSNRLDEINNKIDKLYAEIGKFATAMINTNANPVKLNNTTSVKKEGRKKVSSSAEQEYYDWKRRTNEFVDKLSESSKFTDRNSVLKYLYDYINKTYGIVWDQEKREYRRRHSNISKVSTFDVIYEDEQLRSIFDCTLADLYDKHKNYCKDQTMLIIQPLAERYNDSSNGYMHTCRRVYAKMNELDPNINWKSLEKRYISKYGKTAVRKIKIIEKNPELLKKFQKAVNIYSETYWSENDMIELWNNEKINGIQRTYEDFLQSKLEMNFEIICSSNTVTIAELKMIIERENLPDTTEIMINSVYDKENKNLIPTKCYGFYHKKDNKIYLTPDLISI